jgi:hypothetical protein
VWIVAGSLASLYLLGLIDPSGFSLLAFAIVMVIASIVFWFWIVADAFRNSTRRGLFTMFIPFYFGRYWRKHCDNIRLKRFGFAFGMGALPALIVTLLVDLGVVADDSETPSFTWEWSSSENDPAPDQVVTSVLNGVANGDLGVAWGALPPSYQNDVHSVLHQYASSVDPEVWNRSFDFAKRLTAALKAKRNYIFNTPMLDNLENKEEAMKQFDQALFLLNAGLNSDLFELEKLKTIDLGEYLNGKGAKLLKTAMTFSGASGDQSSGSIKDLKNTRVTVVSNDGQMATLEITFPGESAERSEWVKIEDRWVPKELADEWPAIMAESRQAISSMKSEPEMSAMQAEMMFGMLEGMLAQFENTNSQEEFNRALGGLALMAPGFGDSSQDQNIFRPEVEDRVLRFQRENAEAGKRTAQYDLGKRYLEGDGVKRDLDLAKHWLSESAEQGFSPAIKLLASLERSQKDKEESETRIQRNLDRLKSEAQVQ